MKAAINEPTIAIETMETNEPINRAGDLLSEKEAADFLQTAPGTLSVWRSTGRYALPFLKVGAKVRYRRGDLQSWLDSRVRATGETA